MKRTACTTALVLTLIAQLAFVLMTDGTESGGSSEPGGLASERREGSASAPSVTLRLVADLLPADGSAMALIGVVTHVELGEWQATPGRRVKCTLVHIRTQEPLTPGVPDSVIGFQRNAVYYEDGTWRVNTMDVDSWCLPGDRLLVFLLKNTVAGPGRDALPGYPLISVSLMEATSSEVNLKSIQGDVQYPEGLDPTFMSYPDLLRKYVSRDLDPKGFGYEEMRIRIAERVEQLKTGSAGER